MRLVIVMLLMTAACKTEPPPRADEATNASNTTNTANTTNTVNKVNNDTETATAAQTADQAMLAAPNPDEALWLANLAARQPELVQQVLDRHGLKPDQVTVKLEDMILKVSKDQKSCERRVPRGWVEAEFVTNFDHTLDHCVRELLAQ